MKGDHVNQFFDLMSNHVPIGEAWEITRLEAALKSWPLDWGNHLHVSLYGSFTILEDIDIPNLGIHVSSIMETGDFVFGASFCYDCQIEVRSRDVKGLWDAINRLEIFVSIVNVVTSYHGGSATKGSGVSVQYYCRFLYDAGAMGLAVNQYIHTINHFLNQLNRHLPEHSQILLRTMWWIRQARHDLLTGNTNPSLFLLYLSYWNAFECLIELGCRIYPLEKLSKSQKQARITEFFKGLDTPPTPSDIEKCYREIVNPPLKKRARHVLLSTLDSEVGEKYYSECFTNSSYGESLYQIRNDIDHGNIVEYNFPTRIRVINGLNRLQPIFLSLLQVLINRDL